MTHGRESQAGGADAWDCLGPPVVPADGLQLGGLRVVDGDAISSDSDHSEDPTKPFRQDPELAAAVAIVGLQSQCQMLRTALDARNYARIEVAAAGLTDAWIATHALVRVLTVRAKACPDEREVAQIATRALDAALYVQNELFVRARAQVTAPALRTAIDCFELRLRLAKARDDGTHHGPDHAAPSRATRI